MFEGTISAIIMRTETNYIESKSCGMKWVDVLEGTTPATIRRNSNSNESVRCGMKQLHALEGTIPTMVRGK
jgi:hypothetical protein